MLIHESLGFWPRFAGHHFLGMECNTIKQDWFSRHLATLYENQIVHSTWKCLALNILHRRILYVKIHKEKPH